MMRQFAVLVRSVILYGIGALVLLAAIALTWLRWESHRPRAHWFDQRHGKIAHVTVDDTVTAGGQLSVFATLISNSGLAVSFRVVRHPADGPLPVLLVLGGHRTGSNAVQLFGNVGRRAVVALDYPYDGPVKVRGLVQTARTIPLARQAFLDTTPAVSLIVDWLVEQPWVDSGQLVIVGASLGVPFAAAAAARDDRISGALLVHGAADNRVWLQTQVARRIDAEILHRPLATILSWLAYSPALNTPAHVARISPRPVLIIGARHDPPARANRAAFCRRKGTQVDSLDRRQACAAGTR